MRQHRLVVALFLSVLSAAVAPPALADNVTVDSAADDGSGGCTLREAIASVNQGGLCLFGECCGAITFGIGPHTIGFANGITGITLNAGASDDTNAQGDLDITYAGTLTIAASGNTPVTIHGNGDRIFDWLPSGTATLNLNNLVLRDGSVGAAQNGGAIRVKSPTGGTATLALSGTQVTGNDALAGAGIYADCGPVTVTLTNSSVTQNGFAGFTNFGGGLFVGPFASTVTLSANSHVDQNHALVAGGGIALAGTNGSGNLLTVDGGSVSNNQVLGGSGFGGGIAVGAFAPSGLFGPSGPVGRNCGPVASVVGGSRSVTLQNAASVDSNTLVSGDGGGIGVRDCSGACLVRTIGSNVRFNTATGLGGGIASLRGSGNGFAVSIESASTIAQNTATGGGGGLAVDSVDHTVATACSGQAGTLSLCVAGSSRVVSNSTSLTTGDGGGLYLRKTQNGANQTAILLGGAKIGDPPTGPGPGPDFGNNAHNGGGVALESCASGGYCFFGAVPDASIRYNDAVGGVGGGLYNKEYVVALQGTNVSFNTATGSSASHGGGIYTTVTDSNDVVPRVAAAGPYPNRCPLPVGGIRMTSLCLLDAQVNDNVAGVNSDVGDGGGVYIVASTTLTTTSMHMLGGAMLRNVATRDGGAIFGTATGSPTTLHINLGSGARIGQSGLTKQSNRAARGGGLALGNCSGFVDGCIAFIDGAIFEGNRATDKGGAIHSIDTLVIANSEFTDNTADKDGGAIATIGDVMQIANSSFLSNTAGERGGGIFNTGQITLLANDTLNGNAANKEGAGLWSSGTITTARFQTITDNVANGGNGGGVWTSANLTLASSILLGNTAAAGADCFTASSATLTSGGHNLLATKAPAQCSYTTDATDVVTARTTAQLLQAPAVTFPSTLARTRALLFDPSATLVQQNPAVNAAAAACGVNDARGVSRDTFGGVACDIGAFEATLDARIPSKVTSNGTPTAGGATFNYTITVTAPTGVTGVTGTSGIVVRDVLPGGVLYQSLAAPAYTCTTPPVTSNGTIDCTRNSPLPTNGTDTITVTCRIGAAFAPGSVIMNTARAATTLADLDDTNNAASVQVTTVGDVTLSASKTDGVSSVDPGGLLTYTIVAANSGPSTVTANISDVIPAGLTLLDWSCVGAGNGLCPAPSGGPDGSGNLTTTASLPNGGSVTFTVHTLVGLAAGGTTISNTVNVTRPAGYNGTNGTATETTPVTSTPPAASLVLTKGAGPDPVAAGAALAYTVTLTNNGPIGVPAGLVVDLGTFGSADTTFVSFTAPAGFGCTGVPASGAVGAFTPVCTSSGFLAASAAVSFLATVDVSATSAATIPFGGTTTTKPVGLFGTTSEAPAGVTHVAITADGFLALMLDAVEVDAGSTVTLIATITNSGPSALSGAVVTFTLPAGVTLSSVSLSNNVTCANAVCTISSLAPGVTETLGLVLVVDAASVDALLTLSATLATAPATDPSLADNAASVTLTVHALEQTPSGGDGMTAGGDSGGEQGGEDAAGTVDGKRVRVRGAILKCGGGGDGGAVTFLLLGLLLFARRARREAKGAAHGTRSDRRPVRRRG